MRKYKGMYIDGVCFNREADIDEFLRKQAIEAFKNSIWLFARKPIMERSIYSEECAERLVNQFGFTWDEVEALEIETFAAL